MVANPAFHAATSWVISRSAHMAGVRTMAGFPSAADSSTWVTNPRLNMYGWYCRAASSSHTSPSAICRPRRQPPESRSPVYRRMPRRARPARARKGVGAAGEVTGVAAGEMADAIPVRHAWVTRPWIVLLRSVSVDISSLSG